MSDAVVPKLLRENYGLGKRASETPKGMEEALDAMIDQQGMSLLIASLENVAYRKAKHIEVNRGDAKNWTEAAQMLGRLHNELPDLQ